jgi:integrase
MAITARGNGTWLVRAYIGRDPHTNKRRYLNQTVKGTKKEAQQQLTKLMRELDTDSWIEPTMLTINQFLDKWLDSIRPNVRANTFMDYEYTLKQYVRPYLGHCRLEKITPLEIQAAVSKLSRKGLSARTIRSAITVLSTALKQAVKWRLTQSNPADFVDKPKIQRKEMTALTQAEVGRFLDAAALNRWGVVFAFALSTGMRPSEILGLQWKDVDLVNGGVVVQRGLTRTKGGRHLTPPKTPRSRRTVPLPATMVAQLREHEADQQVERFAAGDAYVDSDFVFASPNGKSLSDRTLTECHFKRILKAAGLPSTIRLYDMRHTHATLLLLANVNPKVVSERLGHSSVTLTLDTYSHVLPTMQRGAADKLEDLLFGSQVGL